MNNGEKFNYLKSLVQQDEKIEALRNDPHSYSVPKVFHKIPNSSNDEYRQKLLRELSRDAKLDKALSSHRQGDSQPMVTFDDTTSIKLFADPTRVKGNIADMCYEYMAPYLTRDDAEQLYIQLEAINPNIVVELVHNWKNNYEKEFKPYYGRYINKDLLVSKIENMTLDKVKRYEDIKNVEVVNPAVPQPPSMSTILHDMGGTAEDYNKRINEVAELKNKAIEESEPEPLAVDPDEEIREIFNEYVKMYYVDGDHYSHLEKEKK